MTAAPVYQCCYRGWRGQDGQRNELPNPNGG